MKPLRLVVLILSLAAAGLLLPSCWTAPEAAEPTPLPPLTTVELEQVWVHGESALISTGGQHSLCLAGADDELLYLISPADSGYIDRGLLLYTLPPACYSVLADGKPLAVGEAALPTGYTLPRNGSRLHWRFFADSDGLLQLAVETADSLPPGICDVWIDVGHGGEDSGAAWFGYIEAEQNLRSSLYMQEQLEALGLVVGLSRTDMAIPGGPAAEDNPYLAGARLDGLYQSQARYVISNHLNGGGGAERGFQIYSSVRTSSDWADRVADSLRASGHRANDRGLGLVAGGVYKRPSQVFSETPRDYYFILRESGGYAASPFRYCLFNPERANLVLAGAQTLLMEYIFLDNRADLDYWLANWQLLIEATVDGAAQYWGL